MQQWRRGEAEATDLALGRAALLLYDLRFETKIFLTKRSPQTLSNLCLSARTESALHITCILTVYTACNVSDSTSDETYTNVLLYWLTGTSAGSPAQYQLVLVPQ